jgi:hypothetical protein
MDGVKFVVANYNITVTSVFIVPEEWDNEGIHVYNNCLYYEDDKAEGKMAQNGQDFVERFDWSYPDNIEVCATYEDACTAAEDDFYTCDDVMTPDWLNEYVYKITVD